MSWEFVSRVDGRQHVAAKLVVLTTGQLYDAGDADEPDTGSIPPADIAGRADRPIAVVDVNTPPRQAAPKRAPSPRNGIGRSVLHDELERILLIGRVIDTEY